jgi:hypothetical protein
MRFPHPFTALRAPLVTDSKGNQIRDWPNAVTVGPWRGWFQPVSSDEITLNEQRVVSRWRLFAEPAATLLSTDRPVWDGKTFQVDGEVQMWDDRRGAHDHSESFLRLVTG